ncbi:MAG: tetratricopeptide repeat protein [Pyrinomonadaceae bacterium]
MKQVIFSIFIILSAFVFGVSAQTAARQEFENGISAAQNEKYETALVDFKKSLAFSRNEDVDSDFLARVHFNIGVSLYRLQRNREAVAEYELAIKLSEKSYEKAFYALGMAQSELKNWQAAERAFLEAIRLNKRNGEAWFDLAFVYLAGKNFDAARAAFQKSIEYKSVDSSVGHNNLGVIFALNGDLPSAVREFETALKESGGKLIEAERNLQFCKTVGQDLPVKLEFGKVEN